MANRIEKATNAYRSISEAAEIIGVETHVLRFWETKFSQIRPMKRDRGRRYYRAEDIKILRTICDLLRVHGYTIKGAQNLLKKFRVADIYLGAEHILSAGLVQLDTADNKTTAATRQDFATLLADSTNDLREARDLLS